MAGAVMSKNRERTAGTVKLADTVGAFGGSRVFPAAPPHFATGG